MANNLKIIKPLVIGIGVAGKRHLEAQLQLGIQTGVYSLNIKKTDPIRKQKNIIVFDNLQEGISWSNLVHVCTPDDKHTEFVALALKNCKVVLCEKSFTTSLKDALHLQKLAHENNCLLLVGQNYRLTPSFAETRKRVLAGDLGNIKKIETTYLHDVDEYQMRAPLRKNKDFLYIAGSHAVDLACWVTNQQIVSVQAISVSELSYKITCMFASGLLGHITLNASSHQAKNGTDLIVEGESGKLISHNKLNQLLYYKKEDKKPQLIELPNNQTPTTALEVEIVDDYLLGKLKSFYPLPDVDEAVNTIKTLDAVQKAISLRSNKFASN